MKRSFSHRIDKRAQNIFESNCPDNWSLQKPTEDYGIDYYIRVFDDEVGEATEIFFAVQLKGVKEFKESENFFKFSMKSDTLNFYLTKVSFPVFLVVVDINRSELCWLFLQKYINETLNNENPNWKNQQTVTLYIPKCNNSKNINQIADYSLNAAQYCNLLVNGVADFEIEFKVKNIINNSEKLDLLKKQQSKLYDGETKIAFDLITDDNNFEDSKNVFFSIYNRTKDDDEHVESHIKSIIGILVFYEWGDEKNREVLFNYINEGFDLSKKHDLAYLQHYFYGVCLEKLCYILQSQIPMIVDKSKIMVQNGAFNNILAEINNQRIIDHNNKIISVYSDFFNNLMACLQCNEIHVFAELLQMLIKMHLHNVSVIYYYSDIKELNPVFNQIENLISILSTVNEKLQEVILDYYILDDKVLYHYYKKDNYCNQVVDEYIQLSERNNHKNFLERAKNLKKSIKHPLKYHDSNFKASDEQIIEYYNKLFESEGIDIDDPDDRIAKILRIGLKDMNPERVLKDCIHLEIAPGAHGFVAEMFGLLSAGNKILFCKYRGGIEGQDLDNTYNVFKREFCSGCEYKSKRDDDWRWGETESKLRSDEFKSFLNDC